MKKKKQTKPNCYECIYRGEVSGDAHSCCKHPKAEADKDPLSSLMSIFAGVGRCAPVISPKGVINLNIEANMTGVERGWFNWPYNFDPVWLDACDGFKANGDK